MTVDEPLFCYAFRMSKRLAAFQQRGVDFVAAVPCSYLKTLLAACEELPKGMYLPAVREDHAVAACAGAWLGGRTPLAVMQNSGLGYSLEVLASLHLLYGMPLPMVISDRGAHTDYEEHRDLGGRTRKLLELFGVPWRVAAAGAEGADGAWVVDSARELGRPAVLLVPAEADS